MKLRSATPLDLQELTELCFRSKASWGYDEAFMLSCEDELSFKPQDLEGSLIALAVEEGKFLGVAQITGLLSFADGFKSNRDDHSGVKQIELIKLFIEPEAFHKGVGRALFRWVVSSSQLLNAEELFIVSDPFAHQFYEKMGAHHAGHILSETMAERWLPIFTYPLKKPLIK